MFDQKRNDLAVDLNDLLRRPAAIGHAGSVGQINDIFMAQLLDDLAHDRQAAHARIKHADRRSRSDLFRLKCAAGLRHDAVSTDLSYRTDLRNSP